MGSLPNCTKNERVWDPLVRLFHWSLVAAFITAWFGKGEAWLHEGAGRIVLCLIIFRVVWGVVGTGAARFETFLRGPFTTLRYIYDIMRGRPAHYIGHNPAGAAMIALMLLTLTITTVTGVIMTTVKFWGNGTIEYIHGQTANLMVVLICGHIFGILIASLQHRENLIFSMISGWKSVPADTLPYLGEPKWSLARLTVAVLIVLGAIALWRGTTLVFDASFWRMEKIIAAATKKTGCESTTVAFSKMAIYPRFAIEYQIDRGNNTVPLTVVVSASTALQKRPDTSFPELISGCPVENIPASSHSDAAITTQSTAEKPESDTYRDRTVLKWQQTFMQAENDVPKTAGIQELNAIIKTQNPALKPVADSTKESTTSQQLDKSKLTQPKKQRRSQKKRKRKGRGNHN